MVIINKQIVRGLKWFYYSNSIHMKQWQYNLIRKKLKLKKLHATFSFLKSYDLIHFFL